MAYIVIGKFIKPFGIKGEVIVEFYVDSEEDLGSFSAFYIKDKTAPNGLRPVAMDLRPHGDRYIAAMEGSNTPEQAELYREREIFADDAELPATAEDEFYIKDLLGAAFVRNGETIGEVRNVLNFGNSDILFVRLKDGKDIAVPFKDEYVESVDVAAKSVTARNIDSLL